jgi:hypothetical protein
VILLDAERSASTGWRRIDGIRKRLAEAGVEQLLDRRRRQRLPGALALSAINVEGDVVEVVAVERREYDERAPELDRPAETADGQLIVYKAYRHVVTRGPTHAALEHSHARRSAACERRIRPLQLDEALGRFTGLVGNFVDLDRFDRKDIG